jgi:hypothetical protein
MERQLLELLQNADDERSDEVQIALDPFSVLHLSTLRKV